MRPTRRSFLRDAAAVGALLAAGRPLFGAPQAAGARRRVSIAGRPIRTVDVHAHCTVPAALEVVRGTPLERSLASAATGPLVVGPERLQRMDEQGIDVEVLTVNPFWYGAERGLARDLVRALNEGLAAICAANPDRFVALAAVALQHPDLAAEQLEDAMTRLKLRGAGIGGRVNAEELAARRFDPFWAAAERLQAAVFTHPQGVPEIGDRVAGNGFLGNVIGNPLETTIALSHLMFEGTLDRFPGLRLCAAHAGGFLPAYIGRFDQGCVAFPRNCTGTNRKRPSEYLRQLYFDSMVFTGEGLRHLAAEAGASQILIGTDYPYPWTTTAVDHVLEAPGLSDADREAILGGNAARLLNL
jgi:aminocarboxymuconate-semialdehyde decarboxylase